MARSIATPASLNEMLIKFTLGIEDLEYRERWYPVEVSFFILFSLKTFPLVAKSKNVSCKETLLDFPLSVTSVTSTFLGLREYVQLAYFSQLVPFPWYPSLQKHLYEPAVFVHHALTSQSERSLRHSLKSGDKKKEKESHDEYFALLLSYQ